MFKTSASITKVLLQFSKPKNIKNSHETVPLKTLFKKVL
jgi:hypothetical protein